MYMLSPCASVSNYCQSSSEQIAARRPMARVNVHSLVSAATNALHVFPPVPLSPRPCSHTYTVTHTPLSQVLLSCLQSEALPGSSTLVSTAQAPAYPGPAVADPANPRRSVKRVERTLGRLAGARLNVVVSIAALYSFVRVAHVVLFVACLSTPPPPTHTTPCPRLCAAGCILCGASGL
jgi:hypothetical protein